jgi:PPM family protein phosphatase
MTHFKGQCFKSNKSAAMTTYPTTTWSETLRQQIRDAIEQMPVTSDGHIHSKHPTKGYAYATLGKLFNDNLILHTKTGAEEYQFERVEALQEDGWVWDGNEIKEESGSIAVSCFSQKGAGKFRNDDAVLLTGMVHQGALQYHCTFDASKPRYAALADGVLIDGQPHRGSREVLKFLNAQLQQVDASASLSPILIRVQQKFAGLRASADLYDNDAALKLVVARLVGHAVTIFSVGDSRAYLLTKDDNDTQAHLFSRDSSLLNDMPTDGKITPGQVENPASIMIDFSCQFIADAEFDEFRVSIVTHTLQPGERLLLCSDGFNEVLSDTEIAALFVGDSDEDLMNVYKASCRAGGLRDFSVIVLEYCN